MTKVIKINGKNEDRAWTAGAQWEQVDGKWQQKGMCAPSLYWMKGLSPEKTLQNLKKQGYTYTWLDDWPLFP